MKKDLTGMRFGKLTVTSENPEPYISPKGIKFRRWNCKCDCGKELTVLQNSLTAKKNGTTSCGCSRQEVLMDDLAGQKFGRLSVVSKAKMSKKSTNGLVTGWLCRCDCGKEKVYSAKDLKSGKVLSCGCLLSESARDRVAETVGQVDGTALSLIQPDRKPNKNNTSGHKGVYWSSRENCWIAKIGFRSRTITIGRFQKIEDAIKARQLAEEEYFEPVLKKNVEEEKR